MEKTRNPSRTVTAQRLRRQRTHLIGGADVRVTYLGETTFKKLIESGDYNQHLESNLPADENKWIDASSLTGIRHSDLKVAFASSNFD